MRDVAEAILSKCGTIIYNGSELGNKEHEQVGGRKMLTEAKEKEKFLAAAVAIELMCLCQFRLELKMEH